MSALHYLDFDLQIDELADARYRARVLHSPAGQAEVIFALPFSDLEIENFLLRISRPRRGVRRIDSPEMNQARWFGSKLYTAVFQGGVQSCLLRSLDDATRQGQGIRLRLRLPPALQELPWEYLYDTTHQRFLAHSAGTPIVRYLDLPQSLKSLTVAPPLNVLVMIASPSDYERLDVEAEWQKIKTALAGLEQRGLLQLTRLATDQQGRATLAALQKQLRRAHYHIFHFIGHGGFDQQTQDGVLLLENEEGRSRLVSGNYLGTLLHDEPALRLAILNACEGARTAKNDPFAGVAQQLVRQGIPAVIAMQFEITDKAAIELAREFYDALVSGYPVDGALAEARKALFTMGNDIEWGTPVLYLRATDGELFAVEKWKNERFTAQIADKPENLVIDTNTNSGLSAQNFHYLRMAMILVGVIALFYTSWLGVQSWQRSVQQQAAAATQSAIYAAATTQVLVAQPTMTAIAVQAQATLQSALPDMVPLIERFGMNFVFVRGGNFIMGSSDGRSSADEYPPHMVSVDTFWIGQTEVTNAQYRFFINAGGYQRQEFWTDEGWQWREVNRVEQPYFWSDEKWNRPNHPVVGVSWYEAAAYARWLSTETDLTIRLPTEAEWEKTARGSAGWTYPWGHNPPTNQLLNYAGSQLQGTSAVGTYPAGISPYQALDMAGNVWEWVADWYDPEYYRNSPTENPPGPTTGSHHVLRGGTWHSEANYVRSSARAARVSDNRFDDLGFRLVREISSNHLVEQPTAIHSAEPTTVAASTPMTNTVDDALYVYVPAGEFPMGSDAGGFDEKPQHTVYLSAFWIMQTEVTNEQYQKCVQAVVCTLPSNPAWGEDKFWADYAKHPVTYVTWEQANIYAQWAGGRLPTEAEWEKAARGTDGRLYPWGSEMPTEQSLNFANQRDSTQPVGSYPDYASPYGALDMAGNVWEWVADWYDPEYYQSSPGEDPTGPTDGERRVLRGGAYNSPASDVRAYYRNGAEPTHYAEDFGFRVVRELVPN